MESNTFDLKAWLEEESRIDGKKHKEKLCFLLYANLGEFQVRGWGILSSHRGHQIGLEPDEALQLIYYDGFLAGLRVMGVDFDSIFTPIFEEYCMKINGITREELYGRPN